MSGLRPVPRPDPHPPRSLRPVQPGSVAPLVAKVANDVMQLKGTLSYTEAVRIAEGSISAVLEAIRTDTADAGGRP